MNRSRSIPALPETIERHFPRIEWLARQALVAQAKAQNIAARLADLGRLSSPPPFSPVPHVAELQEELLRWERCAERAWSDVQRLGGRVTDRDLGFVDFLVEDDDHSVMLCWQLGEETVRYWHRPGERCPERRPIDLLGSQGEGSAVS